MTNTANANDEGRVPLKGDFHTLTCDEVVAQLKTNVSTGLSAAENKVRLLQYGENKIPPQRQSTILEKLWVQINSVLIYILIAGAIISFSFNHMIDGFVIIGVVIINVTLGYYMENKAENATAVLKDMMSPTAQVLRDGERQPVDSVTLTPGDIFFLQPGDIVPTDGRVVRSAELNVLESPLTGESHPIVKLTEPCETADIPLAEKKCMVYSGTQVLKGTATCVIVATGASCEIGKISGLLTDIVTDKTPLIVQIENFGYVLAAVIICLAIIAFGIAYARGHTVGDGLALTIGIAVAAIPEGLPACVTITFSVGVRYMANRHAIVKTLPAVETLGSVNVICSDKTGTLTRNVMVVKEVVTASGTIIKIRDDGQVENKDDIVMAAGDSTEFESPEEALLWTVMPGVFCNDGSIVVEERDAIGGGEEPSPNGTKSGHNGDAAHQHEHVNSDAEADHSAVDSKRPFEIHGDPTETCLLSLGVCLSPSHVALRSLRLDNRRIAEIPFDSDTKYMATMHLLDANMTSKLRAAGAASRALAPEGIEGKDDGDEEDVAEPDADGRYKVVFIKGAPERIIAMCERPQDNAPSAASQQWIDGATRTATHGMRVLGLAYKIVPMDFEFDGHLPVNSGFTLTALAGIMDPPRASAIAAIQVAQRAGITVKMITGDHPVTALAIGKMLGLVTKRHHGGDIESGGHMERAVTGGELDELLERDKAEFDGCVKNNDVFARTTPEHKIRIVQSLQRQGFVCSMTGDGVNDAPALKAANIGVAMGITGTEVAKDAAPVILTDDNFATIVDAVRIGRCTYNNLVKIITFVLPSNGGQAFSIIGALIIDVAVPITALQILWVNMITSVTLGLVLAFDKPDDALLDQKPRRKGKRLFDPFMAWRILYVAAILTFAVVGIYQWENKRRTDPKELQTISVNCLSVCQMGYLITCRNLHHNATPKEMLTGNKFIYVGLLAVVVFQVLFTYATPFNFVFGTKPIDGESWGKILVFAVATFLLVELEKWVGNGCKTHTVSHEPLV